MSRSPILFIVFATSFTQPGCRSDQAAELRRQQREYDERCAADGWASYDCDERRRELERESLEPRCAALGGRAYNDRLCVRTGPEGIAEYSEYDGVWNDCLSFYVAAGAGSCDDYHSACHNLAPLWCPDIESMYRDTDGTIVRVGDRAR